ncbi:MAG TPA: ABC-F family ATP-binding cassette domain-containing protein [Acidimicrobiia bacterium]|nr:ABC-F family ATP-binding cassette domain-containing protein [Acidimicrobiia bacterium]
MLIVDDLTIEIGARTLVREATFRVAAGDKVALVGRNGAGKTTMLKAIAGEFDKNAGTVDLGESYGWLRQEVRVDAGDADIPKNTFDYIRLAHPLVVNEKRLDIIHQEIDNHVDDLDKQMAVVTKYSHAEEEFRNAGGYEINSDVESMAHGVGVDEEMLLSDLSTLSGGQRRKVELARLLLKGGEVLILDEPTNHLDVDAKKFVMDFLSSTEAGVLVVSHDIALMDKSLTRVLALEDGRLEQYNGSYSQYLVAREEREAMRAKQAAVLMKESGRLSDTKAKFAKGNASHAAKRRALQRRIDSLATLLHEKAPKIKARDVNFTFPPPIRSGDIALTISDVSKEFDGKQIFKPLSLIVERGDFILIAGKNGAGKTTLLRCIMGIYKRESGTIKPGKNATLGFYAQEHEDIDPKASVLSQMVNASPRMAQAELRSVLAHFGLYGDVADQEAGTLSGGEKTKMALARLMVSNANVLLLDEPTNNLDPASIEALLGALQSYEGTIILVSHNTEFVTQLAPTRVVHLPDGLVSHFTPEMLHSIAEV